MTLPTCSQIKKVTVITDPANPEQDLIDQAFRYGSQIAEIKCSDGFVFLIELAKEE